MARKQLAEDLTPEEFWAELDRIKEQTETLKSPSTEQIKPETPENEHRFVTKVIKKKKNTL